MAATLSNLKKFCKLSKIDYSSSDTKDTLKRKVNKYLKKYTYAPRYLRGLSPTEKFTKMFEREHVNKYGFQAPIILSVRLDNEKSFYEQNVINQIADAVVIMFDYRTKVLNLIAKLGSIL
jgi:hypothetical protein